MGYRNTNRKGMKQSTSRPPYSVMDCVTTPATRKRRRRTGRKKKKKKRKVPVGKETIETARSWFDSKNRRR